MLSSLSLLVSPWQPREGEQVRVVFVLLLTLSSFAEICERIYREMKANSFSIQAALKASMIYVQRCYCCFNASLKKRLNFKRYKSDLIICIATQLSNCKASTKLQKISISAALWRVKD